MRAACSTVEHRRWMGQAFAAATLLWAVWLPVGASGAGQRGLPGWFAILPYGIGRVVCHQRPERSFHWAAVSWPVCARCTGIYFGLAAAAAAGAVLGPRGLTAGRARVWLVAGSVPAAVSLAYEWSTGVTPSNVTRAATGVLLGAAVGWMLAALLHDETATRPGRMRSSDEVN